MLSQGRQAVAPLYLFLCLLLGGSAQAIWGNMVLQLVGLVILAWAAVSHGDERVAGPARLLMALAALAVALVAVQLIPLPPAMWQKLGGRAEIASDYAALGTAVPALPISLTPYKSLYWLLGLIPPLAMFAAMVSLKAYRLAWIAAALLAGTVLGVLLGALQVGGGDPESSPWYLYRQTNRGSAVGFFANANHMGTLLVVTLPFLAAIVAAGQRANLQRYSALVAWVAGTGLVVLAGIALNGSLAAVGLAVPVLLGSSVIVLRMRGRLRALTFAGAGVLLLGAITWLATSPVGMSWLEQRGAASSVASRAEILETTSRATRDFLPFGSGLGSFRDVYHLYENSAEVTRTYVVHAHNDYAELVLELGLGGILLIGLFLAWWAIAVWRVWRSAEAGPFARAATIASAAILAHSVVDFPLRTAAISAVFAMLMALLADRRPPSPADSSDLRPTRHFVLR